MDAPYPAAALALGAVFGVVARKIFGRSNLVQPNWGEIGVLALCTAWFLGVFLYGTPLDEGSTFLRFITLTLSGSVGFFWGLHLGWSRTNRGKRWAGYIVILGSVTAILLL